MPTLDLDLFITKLPFVTRRAVAFPPHGAANLIRGQFGKELFERQPDLYERLFAPPHRTEGPSGLHDPPRPYVLRTRHLDGRSYPAGAALEFAIHVFDPELAARFAEFPVERRTLSLSPPAAVVHRARVDFLSPTELKNAPRPDFGPLFMRLRDRVSGLRALYGGGALEIDFKAMGERAAQVRTTALDVYDMDRSRTSRRTGQQHPISGFLGFAEYEGDLTEFYPFLEAGRWTGVGRQTVWGKGEIAVKALDET